MPSNAKIFFYLLLTFILGVALATLFGLPKSLVYFLFLLMICVLIANFRSRRNIFIFFILLGLVVGVCRTNLSLQKIHPRKEKILKAKAIVIKSEVKEQYQQLVLLPVLNRSDPRYNENVLAQVPTAPVYQYGQAVEIECQLKNPENKHEKFNYVRYLAKDNIYQLCDKPKIGIVNNAQPKGGLKISFYKIIMAAAAKLEEKIKALFPEPESGYLAGLLLGGSNRLPKEVQEYFRRTGTTHTVAVSGYNITIIAEFLMMIGIGLGLWRNQAFWLALFGIIIFILLIGLPASAVRAAIMGSLVLWAIKKGRLANSIRAIVFAAAIMIALSPLIAFYDVGFQLSFLATLGIVLIYGPLSEMSLPEKDFFELKSILLVTISAQVGVLGLILYTFEAISPISLLANLLVLPLIPVIMLGGVITLLISFISMSLAQLISLPVWLMLHLEIAIIKWLSQFSWALWEIKGFSLWWLVMYYILLILVLIFRRRKALKRNQNANDV